MPDTILLVEDNPTEADRIATELADAHTSEHAPRVQLVRVTSIAAARTHLRRYPVHVIPLDLALADNHGPKALHRLRVTSPNVPVVLVSDVAELPLAREALRSGRSRRR